MAASDGCPADALIEQLLREPYRFSFFQAVRLCERHALARAATDPQAANEPVGQDHPPSREALRFRAATALSFAAAPISQLRPPPSRGDDARQLEMTVNFMGLTGPSGVLPDHYTQLLIDRVRSKDRALADFLDVFNHRAISLFYRAWQKYHIPTTYELSRLDPRATDVFRQLLLCLVGRGTRGLQNRLQLDDETLLFFGGHFAHRVSNAASLESMLTAYFEVPAQVLQFQGHWLRIRREDRSRLAERESTSICYNRLGKELTIGERVWDLQSKFRVRLGPLSWNQFRQFMPHGSSMQALHDFVRAYASADLAFEVQPVLRADEVRPCCLVSDEDRAPRLGWNTWLGAPVGHVSAAEPVPVVDDVVCQFEY